MKRNVVIVFGRSFLEIFELQNVAIQIEMLSLVFKSNHVQKRSSVFWRAIYFKIQVSKPTFKVPELLNRYVLQITKPKLLNR